jgi:Spy/CpxP family protein refolding chaperone
MRSTLRTCLALTLAAVMAAPALAQRRQPPGGGRGGFGGPGALLTNKSVQDELKVTDEQKTKLEALSRKIGETMQEKMRDIPQDQRREKFAEIQRELGAMVEKELAGVLKEDQVKRFKQIQRQDMGPRAFADPEIQKALNLTAEQKEEVQKIVEGSREAIREAAQDAAGDFAKMREAMDKVNKETMGKIAAKLTAEQKKTWKELTGEPFQIRRERPGGRPRVDL